VYLAGPEVFLSDAIEVGEAKKELCRRLGLVGVFPLDAPADHLDGLPAQEAGLGVFDICIELMEGCDLTVANMTPFRGPSMDVGTAVEVGYMHGRGKPVFGYTNVIGGYADRVSPDGHAIEPFGLSDNLMAPGTVHRSTGHFPVQPAAADSPADLADLSAFAACLERVTKFLGKPR